MNIPKNPRALLEYYAVAYGPFLVQHTVDPPTKWREYGTVEYYENYDYRIPKHRLIFKDEIVIEPDVKDKKLNNKISDQVCNRLKEAGFKYVRWHSGNKSNHIHFRIRGLEQIGDKYRPIAKWEIIKFFASGLIKRGKIDKDMAKNKHLIRMEYTEREDKKGKKKLLEQHGEFEPNELPDELRDVIIERLSKERLKKFKQTLEYSNKELPPVEADACIDFILSEDFAEVKDGRKKALFILACFLVQKYGKTDAIRIAKDWNDKILKAYLPNKIIVDTVNSVARGGYTPSKSYKREFLYMIDKPEIVELLYSGNKKYK